MKLLEKFRQQNIRPVSYVPYSVNLLLVVFLVSQIALNDWLPDQRATVASLPSVPNFNTLKLTSLGDDNALAKYLMLWLQSFDNQPGISIPFNQLDYLKLREWLDRILAMDPLSQYPLLSAIRVYAEVSDPVRKRIMITFVRDKFRDDPERRWPWMTHSVYVAKHQLKDLELALALAREIRQLVSPQIAPAWARQMEIYILEDMEEIESAMVLIGGLLEDGQITDKNEIRYLNKKLEELKNTHTKTGAN